MPRIACGMDAFLEPFDLGDVQLAPETFQARSASLNAEYLLLLPADRLLWVFRKNAGLPTPGEPFTGSWEDPYCDLRGHFVGHYISALSFLVMSTGDAVARARLELMVAELDKVQTALGDGYLSAFPATLLDRLEALKGVWAPYYTIHKMMAGLLDAYQLAGLQHARVMVVKMADYFLRRIDSIIKAKGHDHWLRILEVEFGGMNDVLYRLHRVTRDEGHLRLAALFDKPLFLEPLVQGRDVLEGLHANTHLAQVVGFAEKYETTGDHNALMAVTNFFAALVTNHSYATAGSNAKEFWFPANKIADSIVKSSIALETQETCTQYNVLKIARSLFRWTTNAGLADFYERGLLNGILGVQRMPTADVYGPQVRRSARQSALADGADSGGGGGSDGGHGHGHGSHDGHHHHHHHQVLSRGRDDTPPHISYQGSWKHGDPVLASPPPSGVVPGSAAVHAPVQVVPPRRRPFNENFQPYWGFDISQMPSKETAVNTPGTPGVFLYLLPLGAGQSKLDNLHHWGHPFHSFWCCYGTAVEAFAKLADSIYFRDGSTAVGGKGPAGAPPRLFVNQLVSSTLTWRELGIKLRMSASLYAVGPAAAMVLEFIEAPAAGVSLGIMLRIPGWALPDTVQVIVAREDEAEDWARCPGHAKPGAFCAIERTWQRGSRILLQAHMAYALRGLPDTRSEYAGLRAIMMGPFVTAGLTHDTRALHLPGGTRADLHALISEPPDDPDELVSFTTSWNTSQYVRHDQYHMYLSTIEDSGDAMDGTFRLLRNCPAPPIASSATSAATADANSHNEQLRRTLLAAFDTARGWDGLDALVEQDGKSGQAHTHHSQHHMRLGLHEHPTVAFESMNQPGFYIGAGRDGLLVLSQPPLADASKDERTAFCKSHTFVMLPGLDGAGGTASFQAVHDPTLYITSLPLGQASVGCEDLGGASVCAGVGVGAGDGSPGGRCTTAPEAVRSLCRKSCHACAATQGALSLQPKPPSSVMLPADFNAASSFRATKPLAPRYPPGAKVITGINRQYLLAPLGNLVDERYTAYFDVQDLR